jgi:hypothetical protein
MNGQMESITPTDLAVCSCGRVMLLREMPSRLPSRMYTNDAQPSARCEPSFQMRHPRFLTLAPISSVSPHNPSKFDPIYQKLSMSFHQNGCITIHETQLWKNCFLFCN